MNVRIGLIAALCTIALLGCEDVKTAAPALNSLGTSSKPTTTSVSFDTKSPDLALKSWWKYMDAGTELDREQCLYSVKEYKARVAAFRAMAGKIAGNEIREYYANPAAPCVPSLVRREIDEVKIESETRAVILARIANNDPIPEGVKPTDDEKKRREQGLRYKYLMEKDEEGWKVAKIYESQIYPRDQPWKAIDFTHSKTSYPDYVWGIQ